VVRGGGVGEWKNCSRQGGRGYYGGGWANYGLGRGEASMGGNEMGWEGMMGAEGTEGKMGEGGGGG